MNTHRVRSLPTVLLAVAVGASAAAFAGPPRLHAQEAVAREAVAAAAERYTEFSSLCADFEQTLVAGVLGRETQSAGRLCQESPNLFEMAFSDPDGDRIVVDGRHVWVWYRSINPETVIRIPLDPARGGAFDFYREFLSEPLERYEISGGSTEEIAGVPTVRVDLEPRQPRGYVGARVWIDPGTDLIRRIAIEEENGNVRTVTLRNVRLDPTVPVGAFVFEVPAGVSIADPRGRTP
jgi:outer membrane lipoprotein-sorting protein